MMKGAKKGKQKGNRRGDMEMAAWVNGAAPSLVSCRRALEPRAQLQALIRMGNPQSQRPWCFGRYEGRRRVKSRGEVYQ